MLGVDLMSILTLGAIVLVGLFTIGLIFARLYHRASKERAFVRTGLGGQKVVMDGGAVVLPIFHEVIPVNMNTLKLEVMRNKAESLITKDRMRVDIVAAFFVRVIPSMEGIANAAQTLGQRTLHPDALSELVEDKFVDALRSTAATMTMQQLQDQRPEFVQGVQSAVSEDLTKNGLELESVSLTSLDQTSQGLLQPEQCIRCRRPDPADAGDREPAPGEERDRAGYRGRGAAEEPRRREAEARHSAPGAAPQARPGAADQVPHRRAVGPGRRAKGRTGS